MVFEDSEYSLLFIFAFLLNFTPPQRIQSFRFSIRACLLERFPRWKELASHLTGLGRKISATDLYVLELIFRDQRRTVDL